MANKKPWVRRAEDYLERSLGNAKTEVNELDWKSGLSPDRARLSHHLSAFANHENGGFLAFGIRSTDGEVLGIKQDQISLISNQLANLGRDSVEPPIKLDHEVLQREGKSLLVVYVPESREKPVHLRGRPIDDCYVRSAGTTRKATKTDVGALLLRNRTLKWEELPATDSLSTKEIKKLIGYGQIAKLLERRPPSKDRELLEWLKQEGIVSMDITGGYAITNFGAIAAAYQLSEFSTLARKAARVVFYRGKDKTDSLEEHVESSGYAIAFPELVDLLHRKLPKSEIMRKALREIVPVYPPIALRELVANALIHQDLSISGTSPMVEVFSDRIEIRSPGKLLGSQKLDRLIGTQPQSRNEFLASSFRRYRICEERGSGFEKAAKAMELFGLPPLTFDQGEDYFKVTVFSPRGFADMSREERISACYQHAVLKHLGNSALTNTSLRERFKMHERQRPQISKLIRETLRAKKIKASDPSATSNKFAEYLPYWA
jgi:ATP-dependent DNA helicase RecG